jgi:serine/threonine protein kinase
MHRAVKPENGIIDAHGHARALDFGVAQRLHAGTSLTAEASLSHRAPP